MTAEIIAKKMAENMKHLKDKQAKKQQAHLICKTLISMLKRGK